MDIDFGPLTTEQTQKIAADALGNLDTSEAVEVLKKAFAADELEEIASQIGPAAVEAQTAAVEAKTTEAGETAAD